MKRNDTVSVPVPEETVFAVMELLRSERGKITVGDFFEIAADYLLQQIRDIPEDLLHVIQPKSRDFGYRWKSLFLPAGTKIRMKYKGEWHHAEIRENELIWNGQGVSPSQFANAVAGHPRNAWRDVYVRRPFDSSWVLGDVLRRQGEKLKRDMGLTPEKD